MIRACFLLGSGIAAVALSGCGTVSTASGLAKQTGRAALRAAGVEVSTPQAPESTQTADAKGGRHWSENWVWEGDQD
ncbi:hypothetical protein [Parvularcula lutaonensis]|uniref:Lipoprotein n=1 Tax=Parvularcula lutaonensis TaxID=491923 RepID=A0ABV7M9E4_9PROT|nr:hypothetical protein [Parvularcula lutaonensis]GGY42203.1 hypothetical protein GCM10007148_08570 [Parvularcula lutaonensis]